MRRIILGAVIVLLLLISITVLTLYYTQPFEEKYSFPKSLSYKGLEIQNSFKGEEVYLSNAKGIIGTISLQNKGYFNQVYLFPNFIGCLDVKQGVDIHSTNIRNYQFRTYFTKNGLTFNPKQKIELAVDESSTYNIFAEYTSYDVPLWVFRDYIQSISIYNIPTEADSPIEDYSYDNYRYQYDSTCDTIKKDFKPVAVIPFTA